MTSKYLIVEPSYFDLGDTETEKKKERKKEEEEEEER